MLPAEADVVGRVWFEAWCDSHLPLLPEGLIRHRTLESFQQRALAAVSRTRVVGDVGAPVGLCMIKGEELEQLFVLRDARGTGIAAALLTDGEARLARNGVTRAWLACAIGNDRAARFYEKQGWRDAGLFVYHAETPDGAFELDARRFEKVAG